MYESQTHGVAGHSSTKDEGSPSCSASTASRVGASALGLMTDFVVCVCVVCVAVTDFALM